jgi:hypothetical protein
MRCALPIAIAFLTLLSPNAAQCASARALPPSETRELPHLQDTGQPDLVDMARDKGPKANLPPEASLVVRHGPASPDSGFVRLLTDPDAVFGAVNTPRPPYLDAVIDPTFGTRLQRISGLAGTALPLGVGGGAWAVDSRHHYSKDQPWNSDGTLLMLENKGTPRRVALDGHSYLPRYEECANYDRGDDRWHPSPQYPHVRINAKGTELSWFDVVTCTKLRSWTLPFAVRMIGDGEGNPSLDGRYLALCDSSRMFVVDMDPRPPYAPYPNVRIGPVYDFLAGCTLPECRLGWVSVSPSGKYVVCKYGGDYPRVFDLDPQTLALTPRPMPESAPRCHGTAAQGFIYDLGHCDMALNPFDGNEDVLIGQEHCGWRGATVAGQRIGGVVMARLRDGAITPLTDPTNEAYPHHISTQNIDRPGWAYVGYYPQPGKRFSDEIVAVKMNGSRQVERWAHKHSDTQDCYRCESHAVPSRDGRRVVWASNWAIDCTDCGAKDEVKAYVVDARADTNGSTPWRAPVIVSADASGSWDADGTIASYIYQFGDGTIVGPTSEPLVGHTYSTGDWTLSVTAVDNRGAQRTITAPVHVAPPPNRAPIAALTTSVTLGPAPLVVTANAGASSDADGHVVAYTFDFGDGTVLGPQAAAVASHAYGEGTWTLRVTVTDDAGDTGTRSVVVTALHNLIANPSFETSATGWNLNASVAQARVAGGHDGGWSLEVTGPATTATFGANDSPNAIAVVPAVGTRYRIGAWVRSESHHGLGKIRIREYLAGVQQGPTVYSPAATLSTEWQPLAADYVALAAGSTIDLQVVDAPVVAGEVFRVDQVSAVQLPVGAALWGGTAEVEADGATPDLEVGAGALSFGATLFPNPLRPSATLRLTTARPGPARVDLFDVQGRVVRTLLETPTLAAGRHDLAITRGSGERRLGAGVYFYRVRAVEGEKTGRFAVVE